MTTGVFFTRHSKERTGLIIGDKFRNFPEVMKRHLGLPQVRLFSPQKATDEMPLRVHTPRFVEDLKKAWYCDGAPYSVGGTVEAMERVLTGGLDNTLVFTVAAAHHAERDSARGGTYASYAGLAYYSAIEKLGPRALPYLTRIVITEMAQGTYSWGIAGCSMSVFVTKMSWKALGQRSV